MTKLGEGAANLAKTPLGLIALFVLLVEAIAALVISNASTISSFNQTLLVFFVCAFPVLVVGMFWHLVVHHNIKLYSPSEFPNAGEFLEANRIDTTKAIEKLKSDILTDLDKMDPKPGAAAARGSVLLQTNKYITASEFIESQGLTSSDRELLLKLENAEESELEEELAKDSRLAKIGKELGTMAAGATAAGAGVAAASPAVSELLKAVLRLL